jgi:hypothetical protein
MPKTGEVSTTLIVWARTTPSFKFSVASFHRTGLIEERDGASPSSNRGLGWIARERDDGVFAVRGGGGRRAVGWSSANRADPGHVVGGDGKEKDYLFLRWEGEKRKTRTDGVGVRGGWDRLRHGGHNGPWRGSGSDGFGGDGRL